MLSKSFIYLITHNNPVRVFYHCTHSTDEAQTVKWNALGPPAGLEADLEFGSVAKITQLISSGSRSWTRVSVVPVSMFSLYQLHHWLPSSPLWSLYSETRDLPSQGVLERGRLWRDWSLSFPLLALFIPQTVMMVHDAPLFRAFTGRGKCGHCQGDARKKRKWQLLPNTITYCLLNRTGITPFKQTFTVELGIE